MLEAFFNPLSIAVVGVSGDPHKLGRAIYDRLRQNKLSGVLKSRLYAVSSSITEIYGERVYRRVSEINDDVELVVVAVPAPAVPDVVADAAGHGARAVVVISGGFSEAGNRDLEKRLRQVVVETGIRLLGPNTIGVIDPYTGVDTSFTRETKPFADGTWGRAIIFPRKGNVAIISQSGALAYHSIDLLGGRGVGLRAAACVGNQVDVNITMLADYFADDTLTSVIVLYVEGIADGRGLLNAVLKARHRGKQVVVLKAGRTAVGGRAAYTHTASMVGEWDVFTGCLRQAGAMVVNGVEQMVDVAHLASLQKPPRNKKTLILTNAGGFSVLAAEHINMNGLETPPLSQHTVEKLLHLRESGGIPAVTVPANPLDLSGSATPEAFEKAYNAVADEDFGIHLLMPFHIPPPMDESVVEKLVRIANGCGATVAAVDTGYSDWGQRIRKLLTENGVPAFESVEAAAQALSIYASAKTPKRTSFPAFQQVSGEPEPMERKRLLSLLSNYGVETAEERLVYNADEALAAAEELGFPLVMKIASQKISHKSDLGGVVLGISTPKMAAEVFEKLMNLAQKLGVADDGVVLQESCIGLELLLSTKTDPSMGPVVTFGLGGVYTELWRDIITYAAPVTEEEAINMLDSLQHARILNGFRNIPPINRHEIAKLIARFSNIIPENPSINQLEINPLTIRGEKVKAVDCRGLETKPTNL
ncbi:MAG: acetate--CoA ligase family protein [Candidatus Caldarchaeum sp.]|jgi:acyl-CoA synthetase (NDP forming)|uniref:CoA-binding protein n=3 Tax=Caldiarchaeum subterraneum TaxID=311458 RepID=A0A7J3G3V5_CALS0|nr:acetate--CoA ligase family protein [Candidatus Caldarchaeales archaeon]